MVKISTRCKLLQRKRRNSNTYLLHVVHKGINPPLNCLINLRFPLHILPSSTPRVFAISRTRSNVRYSRASFIYHPRTELRAPSSSRAYITTVISIDAAPRLQWKRRRAASQIRRLNFSCVARSPLYSAGLHCWRFWAPALFSRRSNEYIWNAHVVEGTVLPRDFRKLYSPRERIFY